MKWYMDKNPVFPKIIKLVFIPTFNANAGFYIPNLLNDNFVFPPKNTHLKLCKKN